MSPGPTGLLASWLAYISTQHVREISLGLERSAEVAGRLDLLPLAPKQLMVAGTNGKGSTVRFAEALLRAQGLRTGATLSPHLHRYNERVRLPEGEATDAQLVAAFHAVDIARADIPLTYYEYSVLAAFWLFKQAQLEAVVLEIGLGGRLDTINIVDAEVSVVTSIGLDHQSYLGDTLDAIGPEKAAICRTGRPLLLGGEMPDPVFELADNVGARVLQYGQDFWHQRTRHGWCVRVAEQAKDATTEVTTDARGWAAVESTQLPRVAQRNAALAVAAVTALTRLPSNAELATAARECTHPGRFEQLAFGGCDWVVDVAHNPASAAFLARQLRATWPGRRFVACCGFLADKDLAGIAAELSDVFDDWVVNPTSGPRGLDAQRAQAALREAGVSSRLHDTDSVWASMQKALQCADKTAIIVAFGCFLQVQQVRESVWPHERGTA